MCTVSVIATHTSGFRLVTNRDEKRTRPPALPPKWRTLSADARAIWPTDPLGGGTWIGASSRGLVLCVLNVNFQPTIHPPEPGFLRSRGTLIPDLIEAPDASAAMAALLEMDLDRFAMFRLIAVDFRDGRLRIGNARWDRASIDLTWHTPPTCHVSSGLGDALVQPRLPLFERMVAQQPLAEQQDAFHRHQWPDRLPISVLMSRPDARTVSITHVEVTAAHNGRFDVGMTYVPVEEEPSCVAGAR
ncbi:MAG: NRDE family protein [Phycisphaeraceae bacterium]|nr:NRDE family protein [Phycisphaeraceae bacterium]MCW5755089.1 NRDE family protein [Phycisphaeraceae bacterium]